MIESLGTACHHIGQPATVLRLYIDSLAKENASEATRDRLEECRQAIEAIADVLHRLRNISEYRTVPYVTVPVGDSSAGETRIIDIGQQAEQ
jgi:hypothetical protein